MGSALEAALQRSGITLLPMGGRGATGAGADIVLLAVPDAEISAAASHVAPGPLVGHLSEITSHAAPGQHEALTIHPLHKVKNQKTR